jgi:acyl-CoA synthetase (AMP-forming)/AMP-acid ligase II
MFLNNTVGNLIEPLTGRRWDRETINRQFLSRAGFLLRHGLEPGDRVFLHYGNRVEFFVDLLAIWVLGGCAIPIDQRLTHFEIDTLAKAARPRYSLWIEPLHGDIAAALSVRGTQILQMPAEHVEESRVASLLGFAWERLSLDRDALILFTSGTTGQPKGVVHTHRSLRARWYALQQSLDLRHFRRTLCLLPTHFGHGLICNSLFPWLGGQDLYILPPFRADIILRLGALLDEHEITFMSSVPSVWRLALKTAALPRRRTLERVFCGSAPLSAFLWREIGKWTGADAVLNAYGITETGSWVAGTTIPAFTPEDGLIGMPWGATVKILESSSTDLPPGFAVECAPNAEGYVWLNTAALMRGYLDRDDLTKRVVSQGWFMTGDVGVLRNGQLYLCGRAGEEINKGGMKVHPGDVDAIVDRHPATRDVCTFAVDDPLYGQNVAVAVVLEDPSTSTLASLQAWVREHLAEHKAPTRWYLLDAIPRTSRGKVNRNSVAEHCRTRKPVSLRKVRKEVTP